MKPGIIFDVDGTLWDSAANVAESWNLALKDCCHASCHITAEKIRSLMGKSMDEIALLLFPNVSAVRRGELMQQCCIYENRHLAKVGGMLYPALEETLLTLKERYNLMIVSNCQSGYIETFLEHYSFQYLFTDCECFGNTGRCKGENIQMVVRRNGLKQACYVGDTIGDAQASQLAGIPFIFASYGFGHVENPLYRIAHFAQLPEVAAKIFGR